LILICALGSACTLGLAIPLLCRSVRHAEERGGQKAQDGDDGRISEIVAQALEARAIFRAFGRDRGRAVKAEMKGRYPRHPGPTIPPQLCAQRIRHRDEWGKAPDPLAVP